MGVNSTYISTLCVRICITTLCHPSWTCSFTCCIYVELTLSKKSTANTVIRTPDTSIRSRMLSRCAALRRREAAPKRHRERLCMEYFADLSAEPRGAAWECWATDPPIIIGVTVVVLNVVKWTSHNSNIDSTVYLIHRTNLLIFHSQNQVRTAFSRLNRRREMSQKCPEELCFFNL